MLTIVGMNQPVPGAEPLDPRVPRSAGERLWRMAHNVCGCTVEEWMAGTDRLNILDSQTWSSTDARAAADATLARLLGSTGPVVLLGRDVPTILRLPQLEIGERGTHPRMHGVVTAGQMTYYCVPHPSGLCRDYNDPEVRLRVGRLLADLYLGPSRA